MKSLKEISNQLFKMASNYEDWDKNRGEKYLFSKAELQILASYIKFNLLVEFDEAGLDCLVAKMPQEQMAFNIAVKSLEIIGKSQQKANILNELIRNEIINLANPAIN